MRSPEEGRTSGVQTKGSALASSVAGRRGVRGLCALLGLLPVVPLLAWAYGLGSFRLWFWFVTVPALALLTTAGVATARWPAYRGLHTALVVGAFGGLAGTLAYDLFRIPFLLAGYRLLAPIDSYGVLIAGAESSGPWTGLLGWLFHFGNGIGFGITYAVIAAGRRWQWALLWGLAIETLAVASPVAGLYALRGPGLLAIAYGGHLAYGAVLGPLVAHPERTMRQLREVSAHTVGYSMLTVLVVLVAWQHPFRTPAPVRAGEQVDGGPSAIVREGRFYPEWLRVPGDGCVSLRNEDAVGYVLADAVGAPTLEPGRITRACFATSGEVMRVRTSPAPYSGGFVIVDKVGGLR
ncbi:hypothetical protein QM806_38395 [Rhodococcus sp. IEGM 1351]|uniref:hypothetical protein n=1 Tax=Rhodococcus sp. IEGM 1351 TaxID=3047089 RepID=UPI0024B82695|nr:hypothetical protein [Rhodococcus sp. IEGM 1351]MDI9941222.1 hypothetical protein [Rhodococcus sp. IEGM 1351]